MRHAIRTLIVFVALLAISQYLDFSLTGALVLLALWIAFRILYFMRRARNDGLS